jgi:tetratricopeptide (TPR) repeat protein
MGSAKQELTGRADTALTQVRDEKIQSEARRLGRRVILEFVGESVPVLDRIEFKPNPGVDSQFWERGHATQGFAWTEVPQALAILFVEYAVWGAVEQQRSDFFFAGKWRGSLAATLGDAIHKGDDRIHELFVEEVAHGKTVSRVKLVFGGKGDNVHGKAKDKRDRRISVNRAYLPPDCVEVVWDCRGKERLKEVGDLRELAKRIRSSLGLPTEALASAPPGGEAGNPAPQTPTAPPPVRPTGDATTPVASVATTVADGSLETQPDVAELSRELPKSENLFVPVRRVDIDRINDYVPKELIGREAETALLSDAWEKARKLQANRPHVLTFVALGGEGKTSLVAKWAADLARQNWPGCESAFAWSFYHQGTDERTADSSDLFLKEALTFFGDPEMAASSQHAIDKGRRLAKLIGGRPALLILDGLESLQYAPTSPAPGKLKEGQGLAELLKGLAADSQGLCVVTTRYAIPDLCAYLGKTVREEKLSRLSREAGVRLLQTFDVMGNQRQTMPSPDGRDLWNEFEKLVEDVKGHALTLTLLGSYLRDCHDGDIHRRDLVKLEEANAEELGGHAFRVMDAYVESFEKGGKTEEDRAKGRRALALLDLLGLFDRPATADCLDALWKGEAIAELTEPLVGLSVAQRNQSLTRLQDAKLLTVKRDASHQIVSLDAHPLLREYLARRVREQHPEAWGAAHKRLFEHLCATTKEGSQPTLQDLQPLYHAVAHGCAAGLYSKVFEDLYISRIMQGPKFYPTRRLGAYGADIAALLHFFQKPWKELAGSYSHDARSFLFHQAGYSLTALNRAANGLPALKESLRLRVEKEKWRLAAISSGSVGEFFLNRGELREAEAYAREAVVLADKGLDATQQALKRALHAHILHQMGRQDEAMALFRKSHAILRSRFSPRFLSLSGYYYCELLLDKLALARPRARQIDILRHRSSLIFAEDDDVGSSLLAKALGCLVRAELELLLAFASGHQGRPHVLVQQFNEMLALFRAAAQEHYLVCGLLARIRLACLQRDVGARPFLEEAWEIAERGSMQLFLADLRLWRARLFSREKPYPWKSPQEDLAAAEKLINECGYHRRDKDLADAKRAILLS